MNALRIYRQARQRQYTRHRQILAMSAEQHRHLRHMGLLPLYMPPEPQMQQCVLRNQCVCHRQRVTPQEACPPSWLQTCSAAYQKLPRPTSMLQVRPTGHCAVTESSPQYPILYMWCLYWRCPAVWGLSRSNQRTSRAHRTRCSCSTGNPGIVNLDLCGIWFGEHLSRISKQRNVANAAHSTPPGP